MKRIVFPLIFSAIVAFAPSVNAVVSRDNAVVSFSKEDGKKKKKKACDDAAKEKCTSAKGKKSCCAQKSSAAVQ